MRPDWGLPECDVAECFQIAAKDNVATLLRDSEPGMIAVRGEGKRREIPVTQPIRMGHKVALQAIGEGEPVVKYGVTIGVAVRPIAPGEWVHLHNCKSLCDAGSSKLDVVTGTRGETPYV